MVFLARYHLTVIILDPSNKTVLLFRLSALFLVKEPSLKWFVKKYTSVKVPFVHLKINKYFFVVEVYFSIKKMLRCVLKSFKSSKNVGFTSIVSRDFAFSTVSAEEESIYQLTRKSLTFNETDGFVVNSPYGNISMPHTTIERFIWNDLSLWSDREAFVCGVTGRSYTHGEIRDHSAALAIRLRKHFGLGSDDVVAICLPNVPGSFLIHVIRKLFL